MADFNVVSEYTDKEAVEDGVIGILKVAVGEKVITLNGKEVNRVTSAVMNYLNKVYGEMVADVIVSFIADAKDNDGDGYLYSVTDNGKPYWFVANEVGGYTLMRPEDY